MTGACERCEISHPWRECATEPSNIERRAAWAVREHFWKIGSAPFPNVSQADQIAKALNEAGFLTDPTTTQGDEGER